MKQKINIDESSLSNINTGLSVHFLIYKITNTVNGKHYIGQHMTQNPTDQYYGSGLYLRTAQEKYGLSNFMKTIIFDYDNFDDMNEKEKELVQLSNCFPLDKMSYNIREGGNTGQMSEETVRKMVKTRLENQSYVGEKNGMYGKHLSDLMDLSSYNNMILNQSEASRQRASDPEWLKKMSEVTSGEKNGMYGKHLSDLMDLSSWEQMCSNHSIAASGDRNPMYGRNSWENFTGDSRKARIEKFRKSMAGKNKGRRMMINPKTGDRRFVKGDEIQNLLSIGYIFGSKVKPE